jgi:hypothetical protein
VLFTTLRPSEERWAREHNHKCIKGPDASLRWARGTRHALAAHAGSATPAAAGRSGTACGRIRLCLEGQQATGPFLPLTPGLWMKGACNARVPAPASPSCSGFRGPVLLLWRVPCALDLPSKGAGADQRAQRATWPCKGFARAAQSDR